MVVVLNISIDRSKFCMQKICNQPSDNDFFEKMDGMIAFEMGAMNNVIRALGHFARNSKVQWISNYGRLCYSGRI